MRVDDNASEKTPTGESAGREASRAQEHAEFLSLLQPDRVVPVITPGSAESDHEASEDPEVFRRAVGAAHAVPKFEPLEGAGQVPGLGDEIRRRRRSKRRSRRSSASRPRAPRAPRPAREPKAVTSPTKPKAQSDGRRETLTLVAVLAVLIALAAIYLAQQKSDQPYDSGVQGASLVISQPVAVRV